MIRWIASWAATLRVGVYGAAASEKGVSPIVVREHTRRRPVNAKREALHEQLRRELGRTS